MSSYPSVVVAGLSGDSGKTLVALGLASAWAEKGLRVSPFKKGPDYIDAAWLTLAAGRPCRNLDTYLIDEKVILAAWRDAEGESDVRVVEGNRGLFDGMDADGSHSTANLAKLLRAPLLLVIDATKMTRTVAAVALGVRAMDPGLEVIGIVLNRVGGDRHRRVATEAVEKYASLPVLGAIPRLKKGELIPGRHLGLVTTDEHPASLEAVNLARETAEEHLDLDRIFRLAGERTGKPETTPVSGGPSSGVEQDRAGIHIGVVRDAAFPFYYPENIEALVRRGARLVEVSALNDLNLPDGLDALYIGGGFPETHAEHLAKNRSFLKALHNAAELGLPIYAECGGLMLLAESMEYEGRFSRMAGVLPVKIGWSTRPSGHGYTAGRVDGENPFYPVGLEIRGHEFHHSRIAEGPDLSGSTAIGLTRGTGVGRKRDGIVRGGVLALYTHVHAAGLPQWGDGMIAAAGRYRKLRMADHAPKSDIAG